MLVLVQHAGIARADLWEMLVPRWPEITITDPAGINAARPNTTPRSERSAFARNMHWAAESVRGWLSRIAFRAADASVSSNCARFSVFSLGDHRRTSGQILAQGHSLDEGAAMRPNCADQTTLKKPVEAASRKA